MEKKLYISGSCKLDEDGLKICSVSINGKKVEVEILENGERQIISNPDNVDRETLKYAISQVLNESADSDLWS
ncbi:MAG: hypothetical protein QW478_04990 [Candidatus Micrarchaeaceae archaeon]